MENEIPPVNRVDEIHDKLRALQGQKLKVKANMGRSRIVERTGTLVMAHLFSSLRLASAAVAPPVSPTSMSTF